MFVLNDTVHSYQTRHRGDIHIPLTNTTSAQNCIRQYVPKLITSMPVLVISKVNTHSYIGFSNYVKQHLIGLYIYECLIPKLLYLRSTIIYEILPPSGITIIIMYYIIVCITTVYSIFNDMRWNFFLKYHNVINSSHSML